MLLICLRLSRSRFNGSPHCIRFVSFPRLERNEMSWTYAYCGGRRGDACTKLTALSGETRSTGVIGAVRQARFAIQIRSAFR